MGKLSSGILGPMIGRTGGVVGSNWKGINTVRVHQPNVSNPRTAKQVAQRTRFTAVQDVAKKLLSNVIRPLNDRFAVRMSGYNLFIQRNISEFEDDGSVRDPENLVFSDGVLGVTSIDSVAAVNAGNDVDVNFSDSVSGKKLDSDVPYVVVWNETQEKWYGAASNTVRADGEASVANVSLNSGDNLHVYLMFRSADGNRVSETAYKSFTVA